LQSEGEEIKKSHQKQEQTLIDDSKFMNSFLKKEDKQSFDSPTQSTLSKILKKKHQNEIKRKEQKQIQIDKVKQKDTQTKTFFP